MVVCGSDSLTGTALLAVWAGQSQCNSISLQVLDILDSVRKTNLSTVEMIADIVAGDGHDLTTIEFSLLLYQY